MAILRKKGTLGSQWQSLINSREIYIFIKLAYRICFLKAELIHLNVHVVGVIKRVRTICKTEHDDELEEKIWSECFSLPFSRISSSF